MNFKRILMLLGAAALIALGGCATRPVNPPMAKFEPMPYQFQRPGRDAVDRNNLIILAFSGGGTRAAAFSFGVLEALRSIEVERGGQRVRLLDEVDAITGVSGGSFTALAYGLYGEKLFDTYEKAVSQAQRSGRADRAVLQPRQLARVVLGRPGSGLAADLYDEILFNGATFDDLYKAGGPLIAASATDIESGSRIVFIPANFDVLCAELGPIRLARAAAVVVGGTGRAFTGDDQQLCRNLRLPNFRIGRRASSTIPTRLGPPRGCSTGCRS